MCFKCCSTVCSAIFNSFAISLFCFPFETRDNTSNSRLVRISRFFMSVTLGWGCRGGRSRPRTPTHWGGVEGTLPPPHLPAFPVGDSAWRLLAALPIRYNQCGRSHAVCNTERWELAFSATAFRPRAAALARLGGAEVVARAHAVGHQLAHQRPAPLGADQGALVRREDQQAGRDQAEL